MNRQEAINVLYEIGEILAKELGCTETEVKDIDCGFWDMEKFTGSKTKMSDMLKEKYGDMKEVTFHNGVEIENKYSKRWEKCVELGYRFASPQICVFGHTEDGSQTLGKIELSDYVWENGELVHRGEYRLSEGMFWGMEGYAVQQRLMKMWAERGGK